MSSFTKLPDVFLSGTLGALDAAVTVASTGVVGCVINIRGTLVGTVVLEGSTDGFINAQNISVLNLSTGLNSSTGMTASGYYRGINTSGWTNLRLRVSAYTSGSSTGSINLSSQHNIQTVVQQKASNFNVTSVAPTPLFKGRAATFRTAGRAGTTGQNILSIHNATGSAVNVTVTKIVVDLYQTVIKAVTVAPPNIRIWKITALPTNGTALAKTKIGGSTTSNASVTVLGDASADGTGSGTTLTTTRPSGTFIAQKFASRMITAAGYEPADSIEYLDDSTVTLSALEGLVIFLDYTIATQNPVTDMWSAVVEWEEVTP